MFFKHIVNRKVLFSSLIGSCFEFYDFTLYGFLAPKIAHLFFPPGDQTINLIFSYGLFAIGFIVRPIGSVLFGYIGDKLGRKKALSLSIIIMSIGTLIIGSLPTYESIGIMAPFILLFARIFQGLSAGGEYSGSMIFSYEYAASHKGLVSSLISSASMSGVFLGSVCASFFSSDFMPEWGWRIPFFIGFAIGVVGLYIRVCIQETPVFSKIKKEQISENPFKKAIFSHYKTFIISTLLSGACGMNMYILCVFSINVFQEILYIESSSIKLASSTCTFIMMCTIPLFGGISDKVGRKIVIQGGFLLQCLLFVPLVNLIFVSSNFFLLNFILLSFLAAIPMGPMNVYIIENFPPQLRYSGAAFSFSLGMGFLGGTAPMLASALLQHMSPFAVLITYLWAGSLLGGISSFFIVQKESFHPNFSR